MFKHTLRTLRCHPGLWIPAGLSLTLGLAASLVAFSLFRAILWAPLPFPGAERLVAVSKDALDPSLKPADYRLIRESARSFESIAARRRMPIAMDLKAGDGRRPAQVLQVSGSYFRVLASPPWLGPGFQQIAADRDHMGAVPVILSQAVWKARFQGAPDVIGRRVHIRNLECEVVGVASNTFELLDRQVDVWMAHDLGLKSDAPSPREKLVAVARLGPSVEEGQAQQELAALLGREEWRGTQRVLIRLEGLKEAALRGLFSGDSVTAKLELLLALFLLLLAAGSANATLLLLLHRIRRGREQAVRRALGESRLGHLAASAADGVLLAAIGATAAVAVGQAVFQFLLASEARPLPLIRQAGIHSAEILFVLALATGLGLILGLCAGSLTLGIRDNPASLQAGQHISFPFFKRPLAVLNVLQVSVSTVLAISTALLLHSALRSTLTETGVHAEGIIKIDLRLPASRYFQRVEGEAPYNEIILPELWVFLEKLQQRLSATPGVEEIAASADLEWESPRYFRAPGQEELEYHQLSQAVYRPVSAKYFELLRIPIRRGRAFGPQDGRYDPPVAIIDENLARRWWPGQDPVGDFITLLDDAPSGPRRQIVGIAADARVNPEQPLSEPTVYLPYLQLPGDNPTLLGMQRRFVNILLRTNSEVTSPPLLKIIRELDEDVLLAGTQPLQDFLDSPLLSRKFYLFLMGGLTAAAMVLSIVGISGATLYLLQVRRREIGLRAALGATPWGTLRRTLQEQVLVLVGGLLTGAAGAILLSDSLSAILSGVATDPTLVYAAVLGVLALMGLAATFLSAGKSLMLDPSEILKAPE